MPGSQQFAGAIPTSFFSMSKMMSCTLCSIFRSSTTVFRSPGASSKPLPAQCSHEGRHLRSRSSKCRFSPSFNTTADTRDTIQIASPVKVCLWNPLRLHAIENNRDVGKPQESLLEPMHAINRSAVWVSCFSGPWGNVQHFVPCFVPPHWCPVWPLERWRQLILRRGPRQYVSIALISAL